MTDKFPKTQINFISSAEYKDEGNAHFKNGTFDKAVECYTMAQSLDIANPVYPANRAMANLKLKNWKEAEEDCTRALRHDPTYEKALFRRYVLKLKSFGVTWIPWYI